MFDANKNIVLPDLHSRSNGNTLLIIENNLSIVRPEYARWRSLLAGAVMLVGLSGPLQALPENTHSGDIESSLNLNFSTTTPITQSKMAAGRSEDNKAHSGPLEYDLNLEVVSASNAATRLVVGVGVGVGDDLLSDRTLIRESGNASRLLSGKSGNVATSAPSVTLATVSQSGTDVLVSKNVDALPTRGEDNALQGKMLLSGEAARFPYATITLAVLALLGLVSVARRG